MNNAEWVLWSFLKPDMDRIQTESNTIYVVDKALSNLNLWEKCLTKDNIKILWHLQQNVQTGLQNHCFTFAKKKKHCLFAFDGITQITKKRMLFYVKQNKTTVLLCI